MCAGWSCVPRAKREKKKLGINRRSHRSKSLAASDQCRHDTGLCHWLATSAELLCRRMLVWNSPVRYNWKKRVKGMQIVWKSQIWTWWSLISTGLWFYWWCSMPSSAKCSCLLLICIQCSAALLVSSPLNADPAFPVAFPGENAKKRDVH